MVEKKRFFQNGRLGSKYSRSESVQNPGKEESNVGTFIDHEVTDLVVPESTKVNHKNFDDFRSSLINILGDNVNTYLSELFARNRSKQDPISAAVDDYFNSLKMQRQTEKKQQKKLLPMVPKSTNLEINSAISVNKSNHSTPRVQVNVKKDDIEWKRYIGKLELKAWATMPTLKSLEYLEKLDLRIISDKKSDILSLRLFTMSETGKGRQIGRIPPSINNFLAPLISFNIINVDTSISVGTLGRLSIGDSFQIAVDCYLTSIGFQSLSKIDRQDEESFNNKRSFSALKSTQNDHNDRIRIRQHSLFNLFAELGIKSQDSDSLFMGSPIPIAEAESESSEYLTLNQLKEFYNSNQNSNSVDELPNNIHPRKELFSLELKEYQRQGLAWMLSREQEFAFLNSFKEQNASSTQSNKISNITQDGIINPLWRKYDWPSSIASSMETNIDNQKSFFANIYSGELSLEMPTYTSSSRGGIIGDEMGLGKTISALSLIFTIPMDTSIDKSQSPYDGNYAHNTTLVIVPMSLLNQWKEEFERVNLNDSFKCIVHYDEQTTTSLASRLSSLQRKTSILVLTTYGVVLSEHTKFIGKQKTVTSNGGLFSLTFFRIILDEAQVIRNRSAKTSKAVSALRSNRKWLLTGSPIVNKLDDFYPLVKFLELEPWNSYSYWKAFVTAPFEKGNYVQAFDVVKSIISPIFLRRTKNMKLKNGESLVSLPQREITIEYLDFNEEESLVYTALKSKANRDFKQAFEKGIFHGSYTQIFTHILKLRQACCHIKLAIKHQNFNKTIMESSSISEINESTFSSEEISEAEPFIEKYNTDDFLFNLDNRDLTSEECSICTQCPVRVNNLVLTHCGHTFCRPCLMDYMAFQSRKSLKPLCPNCRQEISKSHLYKVVPTNKLHYKTKNKYHIQPLDCGAQSTKIDALTRHLQRIVTDGNKESVVVFSQFSSFLDILEQEINEVFTSNIKLFKFDGRLNMQERMQILNGFKDTNEGGVKVLLLSLKAGGVGLNLTTASRVYLMDPWWSPSVEEQAIDRIHRIGQQKNVQVIRFIMNNSIETKILKIQERKKYIGEVVGVDEDDKATRLDDMKTIFED